MQTSLQQEVRNTMISKIDRKRVYTFVAIVYGSSLMIALIVLLSGGYYLSYPTILNPLAVVLIGELLMLAPAIANVLTRAITGEGFSNTLLRPNFRHGWPFYLAALFLPILAILVGGAIYYLLFPSRFDLSMTFARSQAGMIARSGATNPWLFILIQTAYAIAVSLRGLPLAFGEEFGWRAYLQPKLMPLGPRKAVLLVGVTWAVWHWPSIFLGYNYGFGYWGAPVVGPLLWVWVLLSSSTFLGWLTLRSGSVWPAAIAHGVNNASAAVVYWFFSGPIDPLIGPPMVGIIGSLGYVVLALPIFFIPGALAPIDPRPVEPNN
jgi:membrane protease YdiL (CAAX protease family)